ncbi:MAG: tyrosine-type recombinase/integrase [Candidatus Thiodiazotropha taylori]
MSSIACNCCWYTLHSGRRSLATLMDRENYDLELIQKILGHEDKELTLEYIDCSGIVNLAT